MSSADAVQIALAIITVISVAGLLALRVRHQNGHVPTQRLVLADLVLLAAALEALLDVIAGVPGAPDFYAWLAIAGRGAVMTGVLALLLSYRPPVRVR